MTEMTREEHVFGSSLQKHHSCCWRPRGCLERNFSPGIAASASLPNAIFNFPVEIYGLRANQSPAQVPLCPRHNPGPSDSSDSSCELFPAAGQLAQGPDCWWNTVLPFHIPRLLHPHGHTVLF